MNTEWTCELSCFAGEVFPATRARVVERIDRPYSMEIELSLEPGPVDVESVLGADCVLVLARPAVTRRFLGVVRRVQAKPTAFDMRPALRVEVVPALSMLAMRRDTRIFQDKTGPEIIEQVLGEGLAPYGREVLLDMQEDHPSRDYVVQYQESDLDFVHRLLEEEGISYAFEMDGDVERMILHDVSDTYPDLETVGGPLAFDAQNHEAADAENVFRVKRSLRPTVGKIASRGRDFVQSRRVEGEHEDPEGRPDREDFVHLRGRLLRDDGESTTYVQRGLESVRARARELRCDARAVSLTPGRHFDLAGHPLPGVDDRYLVTEVVHTSAPTGVNAPRDGYAASVRAAPSAVPWRPLRETPKPKIGSIETATVVGPGGEEIHTDEHGRIKVQFHWDRHGASDENSTCWLRVRQAWAGAGWGFLFIPRIGMEVVVGFLEGDPDRPVCLGCLYNADNPPPYPLPDEKTKSTIKTNSSPGGGGFNEWRYEDLAGSEQIYSHAQKDQDEVVLNDHTTNVGHDQTNTVDVDQKQTVGQHQTETVDNNQKMTVLQKRTVQVDGHFKETILKSETRFVLGDVDETIKDHEKRLVTGGLNETRIGDEGRLVTSGQKEESLGDLTQTVVGSVSEMFFGPLTMTACEPVKVFTPAQASYTGVGFLNVMAGGTMTILAPPSLQWNTANRIEFQGTVTENKGFAIGITGLNMGTSGTSIGMAAIQIEKVTVKAEAFGLVVGVNNLALSVCGAEATVQGIKLNVGAFRMINAGLKANA